MSLKINSNSIPAPVPPATPPVKESAKTESPQQAKIDLSSFFRRPSSDKNISSTHQVLPLDSELIDEIQGLNKQQMLKLDSELTELEKKKQQLDKAHRSQKLIWITASVKDNVSAWSEFATSIGCNITDPGSLTFLKKSFNSRAMALPSIQNYFHHSNTAFHVVGTFLQATDAGLSGALLISRGRILQQAKGALKILEKESKRDPANKELAEIVKEWKSTLQLEDKDLMLDIASYGLSTTHNVLANMSVIAKFLPSHSILVRSPTALNSLGLAASGLALILTAIDYHHLNKDYSMFQGWIEDFIEKELPTVAIDPDPTVTVNTPIKDLLKTRREREEKQVTKLISKTEAEQSQTFKAYKEEKISQLNKLNKLIEKSPTLALDTLHHEMDQLGLKPGNTAEKCKEQLKDLETKEELFNDWLARSYTRHQPTVSRILKNAVTQMVKKKHQVENKFLKFKLFESRLLLGMAVVSLVVGGVVLALSLANPITGPILLAFTIASLAISVGLALAGHYLSHKKNPSLWTSHIKMLDLKLKFSRLRVEIAHLSYRFKEKKWIETARAAQRLNDEGINPSENKSLKQFRAARTAYYAQSEKLNILNAKFESLEEALFQMRWEDFTKHANLDQKDFDTIESLNTALQLCDPEFIEDSIKEFFQEQLGLDIVTVKKAMETDKNAFKKAFQKFFSYQQDELSYFIKYQKSLK